MTVPVKIKNATDVAGGSAKIVFNASIVNVQTVSSGHFGTPERHIDNTNGSVHIAVANATAVGIPEAVLANIAFKGLSEGSTVLGIENATLNDEDGNVIIPETLNGTINVTLKAIHNVSIESEPMEQTVEQNKNATYSLTVTNLGNVTDTIELNITLNETAFGALSEDTFALNAGASATAYLNVSDPNVGIYNTTVRATSEGNASMFAEVTVKTNVTLKPIHNVSIKSESVEQTVEQSEIATYTLTVTNLGNVADTINLNITLSEADAGALSEDTFVLNAGASATAYLNVSDSAIGIYNTTVRATSQGNASMFDEVTVKTNVTEAPPSPCFIATAAYGTPVHEDINILRKFRNEVLSTNTPGNALVETYYSTSPPIANALAANSGLRASVRILLLTPLVYFAGITLNGGLFALIIACLAGAIAISLLSRKYGLLAILKSAVPGILSIAVLTSQVFTLGWLGYTWSSCATIAAYILPLIIPISIAVVLIAVIRPKYKNKFTLSSGGEQERR
ncbi:MAG TPA: hypothetical protein C5S37_02790 [Methanophagales archaeon]|nr:hypothetical protein [Methanophagales archaeon]